MDEDDHEDKAARSSLKPRDWPGSHDDKIADLQMLQQLAQVVAVLAFIAIGLLAWYLLKWLF